MENAGPIILLLSLLIKYIHGKYIFKKCKFQSAWEAVALEESYILFYHKYYNSKEHTLANRKKFILG